MGENQRVDILVNCERVESLMVSEVGSLIETTKLNRWLYTRVYKLKDIQEYIHIQKALVRNAGSIKG